MPVQRLQAGSAHDRAEHCGHDDGVSGIAQDRDEVRDDLDGDGQVGQPDEGVGRVMEPD